MKPLSESPTLQTLAKISKTVAQAEWTKTEIQKISEFRVKLAIGVATIWGWVIVHIPIAELKDILIQITGVLIVIIIAYLLGKNTFKIKAGPIEIEVGNGNGNGGNGNGDQAQSSTK